MARINGVDVDNCGGEITYDKDLRSFRFEILHGECNMTVTSQIEYTQRCDFYIKFMIF